MTKTEIESLAREYLNKFERNDCYSSRHIEKSFIEGFTKCEEMDKDKAEVEMLKNEWSISLKALKSINRHLSNEEHVDDSWIKDEIQMAASVYVETLSRIKKENYELKKELEQQRFNNKHNLSIDQTVADKIQKLEAQNKILREALERIPEQEINNHERKDLIAREALKKCEDI